MITLIDGQFVPEAEAKISVADRCFLYGDGVFTTMRAANGRVFRLSAHLERLEKGAEFLGIRLPFGREELEAQVDELLRRSALAEASVRLTLSRGSGQRGYSPRAANRPLLVGTVHSAPLLDPETPSQWQLITSSVRLDAGDPLTRFKTCNKLRQVLARIEADEAGADEALMLNHSGDVAEASGANVFCVEHGVAWTPPLSSGALPGVTRGVLLELCCTLEGRGGEQAISLSRLKNAEGVFVCQSSLGVVEVTSLDGCSCRCAPLTRRLHREFQKLLAYETSTNSQSGAGPGGKWL
jgi:aminodeoxychorismate lyase